MTSFEIQIGKTWHFILQKVNLDSKLHCNREEKVQNTKMQKEERNKKELRKDKEERKSFCCFVLSKRQKKKQRKTK